MQGYQIFSNILHNLHYDLQKCQIEVNGEKCYVEKKTFLITLFCHFVDKMGSVMVPYLEEKEKLK